MEGVKNGFCLTDSNVRVSQVEVDNYSSATENREAVEKQIFEEISEGRYVITRNKPTIVSALGAIPKKSGGIRLIHDCSRPPGQAVNDYATLSSKVRYQSIQDASNILKPGSFMAKVDLKSAYRSVKLNPSQYPLTGLKWTFSGHSCSTYMYDTRLPFGARFSPGHFHRLTQAVRRSMERRGYQVVAFLDDFLIIHDTKDGCMEALNYLITLLRRLGFAIAWDKTLGPSQRLTFLGLQIDSVAYSLSLPEDKVSNLYDLLFSFLHRSRASCRQLQQLAGKLSWAAHVVNGGRIYLQRVLDHLRPLQKPNHKTRLSPQFKLDIRWWLQFLPVFNCKSLAKPLMPVTELYTDACNEGAGMVTPVDWLYVNWALDYPQIASEHINVKETMAIVLAAYKLGPTWRDRLVIVHTDNVTAQTAINKGICNNLTLRPHLRELFWLSNVYNFHLKAVYIPGCLNYIADSLSRIHVKSHLLSWYSIVNNNKPLNLGALYTNFTPHMSDLSWCFIFSQLRDGSNDR